MHVFLPIAEMSANIFFLLGLGGAVGFLSGMFGVGGGFMIAPLLIFSGIPPAVAVATEAPHVVASSVSGALAQWRRNNIDLKLGAVMLGGGILGVALGVYLVRMLREVGQFELVVSLAYILFLGTIGWLMMAESFAAVRNAHSGNPAAVKRPGQHIWVHKLPVKMRFHRSKLYISALPPIAIGIFVGLLAAVMGVGGGFVLVPAMIYLLRVPTSIAVGTSLLQVVCVTGAATVLQASQNRSVDVVLALVLIAGGAIGAQFGALAGDRLKGEQLRFLLAALVLFVCVRVAVGVLSPPSEIYSISAPVGGRR